MRFRHFAAARRRFLDTKRRLAKGLESPGAPKLLERRGLKDKIVAGDAISGKNRSSMRWRARASPRFRARRKCIATAMPGRANSLPTGAAWCLFLIGPLSKDGAERPRSKRECQLQGFFRVAVP
ncbi:MAG: hypothetical protein ACREC0_14235 [Methylocella sp.]